MDRTNDEQLFPDAGEVSCSFVFHRDHARRWIGHIPNHVVLFQELNVAPRGMRSYTPASRLHASTPLCLCTKHCLGSRQALARDYQKVLKIKTLLRYRAT